MPQKASKTDIAVFPAIVGPFDVEKDARARAEQRRVFALGIVHPDSLTNLPDARFAGVVYAGIHGYGVSQEALARKLRVSSATVGRWAAGKNAPHPYIRRLCLMAIATLLSEEAGFALTLPSGMGPELDFLTPEVADAVAASKHAPAPEKTRAQARPAGRAVRRGRSTG